MGDRVHEFSVPAEVTAESTTRGCDCFWHRRIFTHIRVGEQRSFNQRRLHGDNRMPLARTVIRRDYSNDHISWTMGIKIEGALIEIERWVNPRLFDRPQFRALIGNPRHEHDVPITTRGCRDCPNQWLEPHNDHTRRSEGGGDLVTVWQMPGHTEQQPHLLVVWPEAWWWHINSDGRDALALMEEVGATNHGDACMWALGPKPEPTVAHGGEYGVWWSA